MIWPIPRWLDHLLFLSTLGFSLAGMIAVIAWLWTEEDE